MPGALASLLGWLKRASPVGRGRPGAGLFQRHWCAAGSVNKVVGTWLIDQWKKGLGAKVKQRVQPSPPFYATLRKKKDFDVSIDFNCQSVINPIADITKFLSTAGNNYSQGGDAKADAIYAKLEKSADPKEQRALIRQYEKRVIDDAMVAAITLWWYKINPHRSYVKGWKIAPSHYLNQHLDNVWLDK